MEIRNNEHSFVEMTVVAVPRYPATYIKLHVCYFMKLYQL